MKVVLKVLLDKEHHEYQIIDFAIPYDTRVDCKKVEKVEKCLNLARELKKVWNMKVVPLVVGVLGTPAKALDKRLETIGIETKITELQKTVLIHTSRILWNVFEVWRVLLTPHLKNGMYPCESLKINVQPFNNNNTPCLWNSRLAWLGRTLKLWLATFIEEGKLWCATRVRKALYSWLATFLRKENSNIKLQAGESLALVGNHLDMVHQ